MATLQTLSVSGEEDLESFYDDIVNVAGEFLKQRLQREITKGPARKESRKTDCETEDEILYVHKPSGDNLPNHANIAEKIGVTLRNMGDWLQESFDKERANNSSRSVCDFRSEDFTKMCRHVLVKSYVRMKSGWEQVCTVFYCMWRMVLELQQQPNLPEPYRSQREGVYQGFAAEAMQEITLDEWVESHGGLWRASDEAANDLVPLGSEVEH